MAIPQYDAAGDLLAWKLEHTAQEVDDAIELADDLQDDYTHLYNGLQEYSVPEGLFGSSGATLETNTGEILEARAVLAAGGDVESLQRRANALETLYQAQSRAIASLTETLGAAQTQINKLTVHALLDSGWED